MNHVIFVKDYSDYNDYNEARSMISLFHELTHLVDNSDFNGLQQDKIISYELRSTEIKARVYSEFFYAFYSCLCKYISSEDRYNLIHEYNKMLKENLNGLYDTIFNMHESNHALIDTTIQFRTVNDNTMRLTLDNIQYANSLKQIYTLNKFLNQIEEKL